MQVAEMGGLSGGDAFEEKLRDFGLAIELGLSHSEVAFGLVLGRRFSENWLRERGENHR
jgi:hypothetical protein